MLDAFIIDRIRQQREERREGDFVPARIEVPPEPPPRRDDDRRDREEDSDRGSIIIDFHF